ncbi:uncharacterized protein LOC131530785 [Onychostoma macrolepis]|uniref:Immunoglobulin domain-containing protein n=1 Tax=Onychostoma macrolepis TaxID=369639 RepID=A0A7J6BST9_9TELE|nr:uncharacterized protein LOC131530785 [Onychostoma macrolepis]KAF4098059.1 hypothetical protein G5714_022067 [Onychostoma macrolepis]
MMKSASRCFPIVLLLCGVFGADEVKPVSVMEGDSVTLNPDLTQIKTFYLMEWRFGDPVIAQIDGKDISYPSHTERFRGRLQLDQTGSLTIKNMKTKHSGLYTLQISHSAGTAERKFNVTVDESASDAVKAEMTSVSLKEGDHVTLQTDVTQLSGDELIVWRYGDEGKLIAKADIEAKSSPLYYDERFRDRLELDQTGSLIITNTRTTDSGFYAVKISSKKQTSHQKYVVTISESGLSSGAVAGIVVVLLCVAAAAAAGVIYYRCKISELQKQTLTVKEGDPVTLKPNKEIKKDDEIEWQFGDKKQQTSIADIRTETGEIVTYDYVAGERFRDRLELDKTTGFLTIRNSRTEHSGLYTLHIRSSGGDSKQRFVLTVKENVEVKSVEGDSVTLKPDTEIQRDDLMLWTFGDQDSLIAEIRGETVAKYDDGAGGRFSGRLELNETGSLTIRDITAQHTGLYKLQTINSSRGTLCKKFRVYMPCSSGKPVNKSALVKIPLLGKQVPDGVKEQEKKSSV